jgi:WD40 repeat protein
MPPGSAVPPVAFPYAQAPGPYAGYPAPSFPGPTGIGSNRRRKTAIIAAVGGAVVLAGCIGLVIALLPGPAPKPPVHPPSVVLSGASEVATFTSPDGGTFGGDSTFFSPDGTLFAAKGGADHKTDVYVFSATTHKYVTTVKVPKGDDIYPLSITPDDRYMIAAECTTSACNIYEYLIASGQHGSGVSVPLAAYAVNDDGTTEANQTLNAQFIDVWNLQTGKFTGHFRNPTTSPIVNYSLYVSADGSEMIVSAVDGKAYVMSTQTGQTIATIPYTAPSDPQNPKNQPLPQLSPDGKTVYVPGSGSTPPQIWSVTTGTNVTPKNALWPKTDNGVFYSTDGTVAVTSPAHAPLIDVWNVDLGSHVTRATIPGSNDWGIDGVGPSGNEVLFGLNPNKNNDSAELLLYSVP